MPGHIQHHSQSPEVERPRKAFLSRNVTKQRSGYRRTPPAHRIDGGEAQVLTVQSCGGSMPSVVPGKEGAGGAPHCGAGATSVTLVVRHGELNAIFLF